jgi:esterase/lipase superfamily enzyme
MHDSGGIRDETIPAPSFRRLCALLSCVVALSASACTTSRLDAYEFLRRFSGEEHAERDVFTFYYATDRAPAEDGPGHLKNNPAVGTELTWGTYEAAVDPELSIDVENILGILGASDDIVIRDVKVGDREGTVEKLKAAVEASPHKSLLIVLWGYKERFDTAALKTAYFAYSLDIDTPVLLFDWPGNQGNTIGGYKAAREVTAVSAKNLANLLDIVVEEIKPERTWLTASSLGCQVVCDAFSVLYADGRWADEESEISHVLLAAPDVGEDEFNETFKKELDALTQNLTAYVAANDKALGLSAWINKQKRLGKVERPIPEQLEETLDLLTIESEDGAQIYVVDVTAVNTTRNKHHYFTDSPEYFDDFYQRLLSDPPLINRRLYTITYDEDTAYEVLVPWQ